MRRSLVANMVAVPVREEGHGGSAPGAGGLRRPALPNAPALPSNEPRPSEPPSAASPQDDMSYSIVRPTAFFKSVSGQVEVVNGGAPFVYFDLGR